MAGKNMDGTRQNYCSHVLCFSLLNQTLLPCHQAFYKPPCSSSRATATSQVSHKTALVIAISYMTTFYQVF